VTAYYVASESLTNAAKHADTRVVDVTVAADGDALRVEIRDDGAVAQTRRAARDYSA